MATKSARSTFGNVLFWIGMALLVGSIVVNVKGLAAPAIGKAIAASGALLASIGAAIARSADLLHLERPPTSLSIVLPALLVLGGILLGIAYVFSENFEHATSTLRWVVTTFLLFASMSAIAALVRELVGHVRPSQRS